MEILCLLVSLATFCVVVALFLKIGHVLPLVTKPKEILMSPSQLEALQASVQHDTDATNATLNLILGIVYQLQAAKDEPGKVQALIDQISANATALAKAVTDNTPAASQAPTSPTVAFP